MVRYLVVSANTKAFFNSLKEARRYAYHHVYPDAWAYVYSGPDADDRVIGFAYTYGSVKYWKAKGKSSFLNFDGSITPIVPKKSKSKTNDFGLNWNLK